MEAALSISSPVAVSSTSYSQVGLSTVSGVISSSRVVPLASSGVCSLVCEPIPPQLEGGVSVIIPDSVTGLIQSSLPLVQGGKSFAGLFKPSPVETLPVPSVPSKKGGMFLFGWIRLLIRPVLSCVGMLLLVMWCFPVVSSLGNLWILRHNLASIGC